MSKLKGGYALVEFGSSATFATINEILQVLKAGTGLTPSTPTDEMADGKLESAGKKYVVAIRSADLDQSAGSAYAVLKAAEEAGTIQYFRFVSLQNAVLIHDCESAWDEQAVANVTSTADAVVFKVGLKSAKLDVALAASNGVLGSKAITSINLTTRKGVTCWIRSSVALAAGDLKLLLDDTANCASPLELIDIPAIVQNAWTKVYLPFATPAGLTAVISVGVKMIVDKGAFVLNIDDVRAVADHFNVKGFIPRVEFESNEFGKFTAMKVTGELAGATEADVLDLNV